MGVGAGDAPQNPGPSALPSSMTGGGGANVAAQLAQAPGIEANLTEEYW
jgi:hypothetical protein